MPHLFRKLNHKRHWDHHPSHAHGDVQADAMKCLVTSRNTLSVYLLEDTDQQKDRVVAALAVTRDYLADFDLVVVPDDTLRTLGITRIDNPGDTLDHEVNQWHYDLVDLTVMQLARLAVAIKRCGTIERYNRARLLDTIRTSLDANFIDRQRIPDTLADSLRRKGVI